METLPVSAQRPEHAFHHESLSPEGLWVRIEREIDNVEVLLGLRVRLYSYPTAFISINNMS